jgi:cell division protein FtsI/penicillin-binding protein 2
LTADAFAQTMRTSVDDPAIRATAAATGARIRAETGTATAAAAVEKTVRGTRDLGRSIGGSA